MSKSHNERLPAIPGLGSVHDGEEALGKVREEALALSIERVAVPNFDATNAVFMVGAAKPRIDFFRDVIRKRAPDVDIEKIDRIGIYALAAWHVSTVGKLTSSKSDSAALIETANKLLGDLEAGEAFLVRRGVIDAAELQPLKRKQGEGQGKAWLVESLEKHIQLWRRHWNAIAPLNLVPKSELEEGARLVAQIMLPAHSSESDLTAENEFRYRVVSLFANAWEEVRRAVTHIRWYEGDADVIAPSLRQQASGRRSAASKASDASGPADASAAGTTTPAPSDGKVVPGDDEPFKR